MNCRSAEVKPSLSVFATSHSSLPFWGGVLVDRHIVSVACTFDFSRNVAHAISVIKHALSESHTKSNLATKCEFWCERMLVLFHVGIICFPSGNLCVKLRIWTM